MSDPQSYCPFCKRTHDAPEFIEALKRIAKLEAACKVQTEMAPERTVPEIWKALANSEGRGET